MQDERRPRKGGEISYSLLRPLTRAIFNQGGLLYPQLRMEKVEGGPAAHLPDDCRNAPLGEHWKSQDVTNTPLSLKSTHLGVTTTPPPLLHTDRICVTPEGRKRATLCGFFSPLAAQGPLSS